MIIGHIIPFFCPQRLLPYQSMNEDDLSGLLQYRQPPQIEQLSINEGDTSRRIPDEVLERFWVMDSQKASVELPPWTVRDPVVQKIAMSATEFPSTPLSCNSGASSFVSVEPMTPPSLEISEQNSISQTVSVPQSQAPVQLLPLSMLRSSPKVLAQILRKRQQQPSAKKVDVSHLSKPSGIKKRAHRPISRTSKPPLHSMQTRSRTATTRK